LSIDDLSKEEQELYKASVIVATEGLKKVKHFEFNINLEVSHYREVRDRTEQIDHLQGVIRLLKEFEEFINKNEAVWNKSCISAVLPSAIEDVRTEAQFLHKGYEDQSAFKAMTSGLYADDIERFFKATELLRGIFQEFNVPSFVFYRSQTPESLSNTIIDTISSGDPLQSNITDKEAETIASSLQLRDAPGVTLERRWDTRNKEELFQYIPAMTRAIEAMRNDRKHDDPRREQLDEQERVRKETPKEEFRATLATASYGKPEAYKGALARYLSVLKQVIPNEPIGYDKLFQGHYLDLFFQVSQCVSLSIRKVAMIAQDFSTLIGLFEMLRSQEAFQVLDLTIAFAIRKCRHYQLRAERKSRLVPMPTETQLISRGEMPTEDEGAKLVLWLKVQLSASIGNAQKLADTNNTLPPDGQEMALEFSEVDRIDYLCKFVALFVFKSGGMRPQVFEAMTDNLVRLPKKFKIGDISGTLQPASSLGWQRSKEKQNTARSNYGVISEDLAPFATVFQYYIRTKFLENNPLHQSGKLLQKQFFLRPDGQAPAVNELKSMAQHNCFISLNLNVVF
jgi:hypothetical protein